MTIDEAIKHFHEVAEQLDEKAKTLTFPHLPTEMKKCRECAASHRQLAEWLKELKELKNSIGAVRLNNMAEALKLIRAYKAENIAQKKMIAEAKQLLKYALEDIYKSRKGWNCSICDMPPEPTERCQYEYGEDCQFKWLYEDEAKKLIGGITGITNE